MTKKKCPVSKKCVVVTNKGYFGLVAKKCFQVD